MATVSGSVSIKKQIAKSLSKSKVIGALSVALSFAVLSFSCAGSQKKSLGETVVELESNTPTLNSPAALAAPYTVVVSIDGYRADYNSVFAPPNLVNLERSGIAAKSLKPVYPTTTFANHLSLSTGLTPPKHGIVANEFYDPTKHASYAISDRKAVEEGSWYSGEPVWITAQMNGFRTASYFWIGTEANIQGMAPNYSYRFSAQVPNADRITRALEWFLMPVETRPHLMLIYFSGVDTAGHLFGTKSSQLREAVMAVDTQIGRLREGLKATGLPVNLIVVSDHGMQDLDSSKVILIDESPVVSELLPKFKIVGRGPQMLLYLNEGESSNVKTAMKLALQSYARSAKKPFRVLMTQNELKRLGYAGNQRVGDIVIEPDMPWIVGVKARPPSSTGGNNGWDPKNQSMHGILYAEGPAFKERGILPTVDAVNVAPLILKTLGLTAPVQIDGKLDAIKPVLKEER